MTIRLSNGKLRLRNGGIALALGAALAQPPVEQPPAGPSATSLSFVEYENKRLFQRTAPGAGKTIGVAVNYEGSPTLIEVRAIDADTLDPVTQWATLQANPTGGQAIGAHHVPDALRRYRFETRDGTNTAVKATTQNLFHVGAIVIDIGQSNMENLPGTVFEYPNGHPFALQHSTEKPWHRMGIVRDGYPPSSPSSVHGGTMSTSTNEGGSYGGAWVYGTNELVKHLNVPVCRINLAAGGTNIGQWLAVGSTLWKNVTDMLAAIGGDAELFNWYQGEANASSNTSTASMITSLSQLHQKIKDAVASQRGALDVKFGIFALGAGGPYGNSLPGAFGAMRLAHVQYATNTPGAFLLTSAHDGATSDAVHQTGAAQTRLWRRAAKSILHQYGIGTSGNGPRITGASRSGTVITVQVAHAGGTALMDGNGSTSGAAITGFQAYDDDVEITGLTARISSATTIEVTMPSIPAGVLKLSYALMYWPTGDEATRNYLPERGIYDNASDYMRGTSTVGCILQPCAAMAVTGG